MYIHDESDGDEFKLEVVPILWGGDGNGDSGLGDDSGYVATSFGWYQW